MVSYSKTYRLLVRLCHFNVSQIYVHTGADSTATQFMQVKNWVISYYLTITVLLSRVRQQQVSSLLGVFTSTNGLFMLTSILV